MEYTGMLVFFLFDYCVATGIGNSTSKASLLAACPTAFPASAGSYSDCTYQGTERIFLVSSGTLTLTSCKFTSCGYSSTDVYAGCMYFSDSTVANIYSCSFKDCHSGSGGAIKNDSKGTVTLKDCEFDSCYSFSYSGGAITTSGGKLINENNNFTNCWTDGHGGSIMQYRYVQSGNDSITNCRFSNGKAQLTGEGAGGGVLFCDGVLTVSECTFVECHAVWDGGAIAFFDAMTNDNVIVTISSCEIIRCTAGVGGGAISVSSQTANHPTITLSSVLIQDCSASSSYGQAIHIYSCSSFTWSNLCIVGTGTLIKSATTAISVPSSSDMTSGCPAPTPSVSRSPSPSPSATFVVTEMVESPEMPKNDFCAFVDFIYAFGVLA